MGRGLYTDHRAIEPREGGGKGGREEAGREGKEKDLGSEKMRGREGRIKEGREKKGSREGPSSLSPSNKERREGPSSLSPSNKERREGAKEGGRITGSLDLFIPSARATKVDKGGEGREGGRERGSE